MAEAFIEVDRGPAGAPARFARPTEIVSAPELDAVPAALAALDRALGGGAWVAGFASYELGYAFEPRLAPLLPAGRRLPLLAFGVFGPPGPARAGGAGRLARAVPAGLGRRRLRRGLRAGGGLHPRGRHLPGEPDHAARAARWGGTPAAIHARLAARQPVGHGALVVLPGATLLSRSPELFFALDGAGGIEARPMKGTAPREPDPARDAGLAAALGRDEKNRAENLMIVDLLAQRHLADRRDRVGARCRSSSRSRAMPRCTRWSSRVTGRLLPGTRLARVFAALFPCGSVTGAPKLRAMQIIRELEPWPREAYCGAIGWAAPDGRASFNVAIRTLALYPDGEAVLNVGGGVVADSTAAAEYEEALWKARFAAPLPAT